MAVVLKAFPGCLAANTINLVVNLGSSTPRFSEEIVVKLRLLTTKGAAEMCIYFLGFVNAK